MKLRSYIPLGLFGVALYFLFLVLSTYFYDITRWTYRHSLNPQLPYKRDYHLIVVNFAIVTAAFFVYWVSRG